MTVRPPQQPLAGAFEALFRSTVPPRDKFLSRLFGLFSEDVVRHWCRCPQGRYEDLGRPYLVAAGESRGHTLDFTLRDRKTNQVYIAELKCELEYDRYRYLRLADCEQLRHHTGAAFSKLLAVARDPCAMNIRVAGKPVQVDGAILVWGATTVDGSRAVQSEFGFTDVLSVEDMVADLRRWRCAHWSTRVEELRRWSNELFDALG